MKGLTAKVSGWPRASPLDRRVRRPLVIAEPDKPKVAT